MYNKIKNIQLKCKYYNIFMTTNGKKFNKYTGAYNSERANRRIMVSTYNLQPRNEQSRVEFQLFVEIAVHKRSRSSSAAIRLWAVLRL